MKRLCFLSLILTVFFSHMAAQSLWDISKPDKRLSFGIVAGFDNAYINHEAMSSSKTGLYAGGFIDYHIIKSLALEAQISYAQKGFKGSFGKATMHYVQVPLYLSWRFETQTHVQFHINVGPYCAYGFGGNVHFEPSTAYPVYYFDQDCFGDRGFFKDIDAGAILGGTIQLKKLRLSVSYELGLMNIAEVYGEMQNRNITITAGYEF